MKVLTSPASGLCAIGEGDDIEVVNLVNMTKVAPEIRHLVCGGVDDWEFADGDDRQILLDEQRKRYYLARAQGNIEFCLLDISDDLRQQLLCEVENTLKVFDIQRQLVGILLRAPLRSTKNLVVTIKISLSSGFGATAAILEKLRESQPLLQRLVDRWLAIPEEKFISKVGWRQEVW
jgi:hypothetical protein